MFRREDSIFDAATIQLYGLDREKQYSICDVDTNETVVKSGKDLIDQGMTFRIDSKKQAKIYSIMAK